jgi:Arc/MetJ-type ribon-helix-helix transcriptional regulator
MLVAPAAALAKRAAAEQSAAVPVQQGGVDKVLHIHKCDSLKNGRRMEKATLTISLPRTVKEFIAAKLREGRFSSPSVSIRSLIRDDQDLTAKPELALLARRGVASSPKAKRCRHGRTKRK